MPGAVGLAVLSARGRLAHNTDLSFYADITRVAEQTVRILEVPGHLYPQYPTGMTTLVYPHAN